MAGFQVLWKNHPTVKGENAILDKKVYPNQCAVKMHVCLERSGFDLKTFRGARSWQKDKPAYAIRAQELADWLTSPFSKLSGIQKYKGKDAFEKVSGKTGIIFFQNYWGTGNQGDHIDLWNGSRLTDWWSWVRINVRVGEVGLGSDMKKSQSIWFWQVL